MFSYFYLQMSNFMCSHNDTAETASILNDSNAVDFFQTFVHNAGTANICKTFFVLIHFLAQMCFKEQKNVEKKNNNNCN